MGETSMMDYSQARDAITMHLRQDADAHEAANYDAIGRRFDAVEHQFPTGIAHELGRLHIALTFWDGWIHGRNHGWPPGPIATGDWPALAREVAADLEADRDVTNPDVLRNFDIVGNPKLNDRVQILAARLREHVG
ncbi:MAG: hypothetical protein ABIS03_02400 [Gemmatimonadaceae bacterium]